MEIERAVEDFAYKEEDNEYIVSNSEQLTILYKARSTSQQNALIRNSTVWPLEITINLYKSAPSFKSFKQSMYEAFCDFSIDRETYHTWLREREVFSLQPKLQDI